MKYGVLLLIIFVNSSMLSRGQEVFSTNNGIIVIKGSLDSTEINLISNNLVVLLNYETADINFKINLQKLKSNKKDTTFAILNKSLEFTGKLGIEYINTKGHPVQKFTLEGSMDIDNNSANLWGEGSLEHLYSGGSMACLLNLNFFLEKGKVAVLFPGHNADTGMSISVVYSVLDKDVQKAIQQY